MMLSLSAPLLRHNHCADCAPVLEPSSVGASRLKRGLGRAGLMMRLMRSVTYHTRPYNAIPICPTLPLQRCQPGGEALDRAARPLDRRGVGEAHPVRAKPREVRARHNRHAPLLRQVLAKLGAVGHACRAQPLADLDESVVALAENGLEAV